MKKNDNLSKTREYLEQEKNKFKEREIKIKEIISNYEYINWLEEWTIKNPNFNDYLSLTNKNNISDNDLENINKLNLFFSGIERYASKNYIYPTLDSSFTEYYKIKYNNIGYYIGLITEKGIISFCKRTNEIDESFIDLNDIILDKKNEVSRNIEIKLQELYNQLIFYYQNGIPLEAIKTTVENAFLDIDEIKNNDKKMRK